MLLDDIEMKTHRVNELIELLHPAWQEDPDLNLMQFCKTGEGSGLPGRVVRAER